MGYKLSKTVHNGWNNDFHYTININDNGINTVKVVINDEVKYDGVAKHIIDDYESLSFKDAEGKVHKYQYRFYTVTF